MAKTDWGLNDVVQPSDMNTIGQEINQLRQDVDNIDIPSASLTEPGIVQLSSALDGMREDRAATEKAVGDVAAHLADLVPDTVPHLGTTTNSGNAYSITTAETIAVNQKFTVKFNAASTGAATLNVSTIGGAKGIKKPGGTDASIKIGVYTVFWDGTNFQLLGEGGDIPTAGKQSYTSPGTFSFTVPDGVTRLTAVIAGAGGGGGSGYNNTVPGGGGGSGGIAFVTFDVTPGQICTVEVGTGGSGGTYPSGNGVSGGNSALTAGGITIAATGGTGGQAGFSSGGTFYAGSGGGGGGFSNLSTRNGYGVNGGTGINGMSNGAGGNGAFNGFGNGGTGGNSNSSGSPGTSGKVYILY